MPRKDRRFTGDDLRRLYCKNLSPVQRRLFDLTSCDFADLDEQEIALKLVSILLSPPLSDAIELLPGGGWGIKGLEAVQLILQLRPDDIEYYLAPGEAMP